MTTVPERTEALASRLDQLASSCGGVLTGIPAVLGPRVLQGPAAVALTEGYQAQRYRLLLAERDLRRVAAALRERALDERARLEQERRRATEGR